MSIFHLGTTVFSGIGQLEADVDASLREVFQKVVAPEPHIPAEKRVYSQVLLDMPVRYKLGHSWSGWKAATGLDVSRHGLRIRAKDGLPINRDVYLELDSEGKKLFVNGRINWSMKNEEFRACDTSIEIMGIDMRALVLAIVKASADAADGSPDSMPIQGMPKPEALAAEYVVKPLRFWRSVEQKDLSNKGVRIEIPQLIPLNTPMGVELKLAGGFERRRFSGILRWLRSAGRPGHYEGGIQFRWTRQVEELGLNPKN